MPKLTNRKKILLLEIEKQRALIEYSLSSNEITDEDIIGLANVEKGYGLSKSNSRKERILKGIYNSPFLLCDQSCLGMNVKKILPMFLFVTYKAQIDELKYYYEQGQYSKEEFEKEKDLIEFMYYKSSEDGKAILKTGHAKNIVDNIVRCK